MSNPLFKPTSVTVVELVKFFHNGKSNGTKSYSLIVYGCDSFKN